MEYKEYLRIWKNGFFIGLLIGLLLFGTFLIIFSLLNILLNI